MKHIPKYLVPAIGLAFWGILISLTDGYDFTYYWLTAMATAFVTGLFYRQAAKRELRSKQPIKVKS